MANINGNEIYFGIVLETGGGEPQRIGLPVANAIGTPEDKAGTLTQTEEE